MGELFTVPKNIIVKAPITDQVWVEDVAGHFDATSPYAVINYELRDPDNTSRILEKEFIKLEGSDFTDLYSATGYTGAATLKTRAQVLVWADIQVKFTTEDK